MSLLPSFHDYDYVCMDVCLSGRYLNLTEQDGDANETEDSSENQASDTQSVVVCRKVVVND